MIASCLKNKFAVLLGHIIFRNNDPFGSLTHVPVSESFLTFQALLYLGLGFSSVKQVQNPNSIQYYSFHSHNFFSSLLPTLLSLARRPCLGPHIKWRQCGMPNYFTAEFVQLS